MEQKLNPKRKNALPGELQRSAPRPVRLTGIGLTLAVTLISLIVGGIGAGFWIYQKSTGGTELAMLIETQGKAASARVIDVRQIGNDRNTALLSYRYDVDGREFVGRTKLRKRDHHRFRIGSSVSVIYLPSKPEASWIRGYEPNGLPLWLAPAICLFLLLSALVIGSHVRWQFRLLANGRSALALVRSSEKVKGREHATWRVHYEWRLLSGKVQQAQYETVVTPPAPGALIPIVYNREQPRNHARYPLPLVRIVRL